jgi:hypothetical protein
VKSDDELPAMVRVEGHGSESNRIVSLPHLDHGRRIGRIDEESDLTFLVCDGLVLSPQQEAAPTGLGKRPCLTLFLRHDPCGDTAGSLSVPSDHLQIDGDGLTPKCGYVLRPCGQLSEIGCAGPSVIASLDQDHVPARRDGPRPEVARAAVIPRTRLDRVRASTGVDIDQGCAVGFAADLDIDLAVDVNPGAQTAECLARADSGLSGDEITLDALNLAAAINDRGDAVLIGPHRALASSIAEDDRILYGNAGRIDDAYLGGEGGGSERSGEKAGRQSSPPVHCTYLVNHGHGQNTSLWARSKCVF